VSISQKSQKTALQSLRTADSVTIRLVRISALSGNMDREEPYEYVSKVSLTVRLCSKLRDVCLCCRVLQSVAVCSELQCVSKVSCIVRVYNMENYRSLLQKSPINMSQKSVI